ncbi:MAG: helix-turn-helix transcriptional regulator, partial [Planctomycetota bacterium]
MCNIRDRVVTMPDISDTLRAALRRCAEPLRHIGEATDISYSQLSRFENGKTMLALDKAQRLADYLGLKLVLRKKIKRKGRNP